MKLMFDHLEDMIVATAESVRPPERLTVSQAAAKYRYLNNPGSYVGPWPNEKTPYLVEPMDTLTSLDYTGMVFVGPARTGKSDMFFNYLAYTAICDPADMMVIHMTQNVARDWSRGDLAKAFRHSKELGKRLVPGTQNDNVFDKFFLSGMRLLIKWPTITELSGKTIPRLWVNDYDRMTQDVDGEGNPFDLARKRAQTFKRYGMTVAESSPGFPVTNSKWIKSSPHEAPPTKGILALYNRGDRRRWYWRCPHCSEAFEPDFKHLVYPDEGDPMERAEQTVMVCPNNGCILTPDMQYDLNLGGKWIKEGQQWLPDGSVVGTPRRSDIASFWMKGPAAAFTDWKSLVHKYIIAEEEFERTGSEEALKVTVNVDQGEPYTPKSLEAGRLPEELKDRAEDWGGSKEEPVVPEGVRFLVATIDVQAGGKPSFVVHVYGVGEGGDIWHVDMFKIRKSERLDADGERHLIDPAAYPEDWDLLVPQVIEKTYPLADGSGRHMQIKIIGCDSGGAGGSRRDKKKKVSTEGAPVGVTANAYAFWRRLRDDAEGRGYHNRFHLLKGAPSATAPRLHRTFPDSGQKGKFAIARGDVPVWLVNSNIVKDQVYNKLGRTEPGGMVHFPVWAEDWLYTQLTTEIRTSTGWENPSGRKNEAWDLLCYASAICLHPSIRIEQLDWANPPTWATEWDKNTLVFEPNEDGVRAMADEAIGPSLEDLGDMLA